MAAPITDQKIGAHDEHLEALPHTEDNDLKGHENFGRGLVKSRFDELGLWKTLWVFRRATFYCLLVYTGFLLEGFEVSLPVGVFATLQIDRHQRAIVLTSFPAPGRRSHHRQCRLHSTIRQPTEHYRASCTQVGHRMG